MTEKQYWIWISRIKKVINIKKINLLKKYETPEKIYNLSYKELIKEKDLTTENIFEILNQEYRKNLDYYESYMEKSKIEIIPIYSELYPNKLKNIIDPPIVLYVKGNKNILNEMSIAIVGCRLATQYGKNLAEKMSYELAEKSINIISGLAIGVDSYAHLGVIKGYNKNNRIAKTIAIIGNGLDDIYPRENKKIAEEIIKTGGAIVSEYIIGTKPEKSNFPVRNRIISGLSDGVLVIEAKEKSGTLITVDFALEQGKEVYAIPGNITNINSIGTNKLIKEGATIVTEAEDILSNLTYKYIKI